jgi:hypothetical protein
MTNKIELNFERVMFYPDGIMEVVAKGNIRPASSLSASEILRLVEIESEEETKHNAEVRAYHEDEFSAGLL